MNASPKSHSILTPSVARADVKGLPAIEETVQRRWGASNHVVAGRDAGASLGAVSVGCGPLLLSQAQGSGYTLRASRPFAVGLSLPVNGAFGIKAGGRDHEVVAGRNAHLIMGDVERVIARPERFRSVFVALDRRDEGWFARAGFEPLKGDAVARLADARHPVLAKLMRLCAFALDEASRPQGLWGDASQSRLMSELLQLGLLDLAAAPAASDTAEPTHLRRAEEYLLARVHGGVSLEEMAEHAGVSLRAIQLAFKKHRGVTPGEFLRTARLDAARERLARAHAHDGENVTRIALACGFTRMGDFSARYAARFGEKPSETLRLARVI